MADAKKMRVAVVGAAGLVGEALLDVMVERDFPVTELIALGRGNAGDTVMFRGRPVPVKPLTGFDFRGVDIAFFCAGPDAAEDASRAVEAGCRVVDIGGHWRGDASVPTVVAGVNDPALEGLERPLVSSPGGLVVALAQALAALAASGLERVEVVSMEAVSGRGRAGVDELAGQSVRLLNAQSIDKKGVFPAQIAFNVLPQVAAGGDPEAETALELGRVLDLPPAAFNVTRVQVPVFHGHAAALHLGLRDPLPAARAVRLLRAAGLEHVTGHTPGYPTPVGDCAGHDEVFFGRVRNSGASGHGINLWLVADNVRKGAAVNSVQIGEILIKIYP